MFRREVRLSDGRDLVASTESNYLHDDYPEKGLDADVRFNLTLEKDGKTEPIHLAFRNYIGGFQFAPMPGCCGIVVSTATFLRPDFRGGEISQKFRELKENIARDLGYSVMIATGITGDIASHKNLLKSKYELVKNFRNKRTGNTLDVAIKVL